MTIYQIIFSWVLFSVIFYAALRGKIDERRLSIASAVFAIVFTSSYYIFPLFKSSAQNIAPNTSPVVQESRSKTSQNDPKLSESFFPSATVQPKIDGNDVLVPLIVLLTIPGFDPAKDVYIACDENGWLSWARPNKKSQQSYIMEREANGSWWRAKDFSGIPFLPCQLKQQNLKEMFSIENISWARLHDLRKDFNPWDSFKERFIVDDHLIVK